MQTASGIIVTDPNDLSMTTPYGPPSKDAYVYPVPNDCVGLVIRTIFVSRYRLSE